MGQACSRRLAVCGDVNEASATVHTGSSVEKNTVEALWQINGSAHPADTFRRLWQEFWAGQQVWSRQLLSQWPHLHTHAPSSSSSRALNLPVRADINSGGLTLASLALIAPAVCILETDKR